MYDLDLIRNLRAMQLFKSEKHNHNTGLRSSKQLTLYLEHRK
jgi:hypothetical protein